MRLLSIGVSPPSASGPPIPHWPPKRDKHRIFPNAKPPFSQRTVTDPGCSSLSLERPLRFFPAGTVLPPGRAPPARVGRCRPVLNVAWRIRRAGRKTRALSLKRTYFLYKNSNSAVSTIGEAGSVGLREPWRMSYPTSMSMASISLSNCRLITLRRGCQTESKCALNARRLLGFPTHKTSATPAWQVNSNALNRTVDSACPSSRQELVIARMKTGGHLRFPILLRRLPRPVARNAPATLRGSPLVAISVRAESCLSSLKWKKTHPCAAQRSVSKA